MALAAVVAGSPPAASAAPDRSGPGASYTWIGSSNGSGGDGTSWMDPRNWSPAGVPDDSDSVTIVAAAPVCSIDIQGVPSLVALDSFSMSSERGCRASVSGLSLSTYGTFDWQSGTLALDVTLGPTTKAQVVGRGRRVLGGVLDVATSLHLSHARIQGADGGSVYVGYGGTLAGVDAVVGVPVVNASGLVVSGDATGGRLVVARYRERPTGTTVVHLFDARDAFVVRGPTLVMGTVEYANARGYRPPVGGTAVALRSSGRLRWEAKCVATTGHGSRSHHYETVTHRHDARGRVVVQWTSGASDTC